MRAFSSVVAALNLVAVIATPACRLDPLGKNQCMSDRDCRHGNVCVFPTCVPAVEDGRDPQDGGVPDGDAASNPIPAGPDAGHWSPANVAEQNTLAHDTYPQVAIDSSGNAILVWLHNTEIWVNRYQAQTGTWGAQGQLGTAIGSTPLVALDGRGVATVLWGNVEGLWASTSDGDGWTLPVLLSVPGRADRLAVSSNGAAITVFRQTTVTNFEYDIGYVARSASGQWGPSIPVENASSSHAPNVAIDDAGNGFVLWDQFGPLPNPGNAQLHVWFSPFADGKLGTPERMTPDDDGLAADADIALTRGGDAMAVWVQEYADHTELWSRQYVGQSWESPRVITTITPSTALENLSKGRITVAVNDAGDAVAIWTQQGADGRFNTYLSRRMFGQAQWSVPLPLEDDNQADQNINMGRYVAPHLGIDGGGNIFAIWRKVLAPSGPSPVNLWARRLAANGTLGPAARLDGPSSVFIQDHQLAVAPNGIAIAVWQNRDDNNIWNSVYR